VKSCRRDWENLFSLILGFDVEVVEAVELVEFLLYYLY